MDRYRQVLQAAGLLPLCDLLGQVEGLDWYAEDTGGATMVVFVRLPAGGLIGITRGSHSTDNDSPDGWLACYYKDFDDLFESGGHLLLDDAMFADLLQMFVLFAPGRPTPDFLREEEADE